MSDLKAVLDLFEKVDEKIDKILESQNEMKRHIENHEVHLDLEDRKTLDHFKKKGNNGTDLKKNGLKKFFFHF